MRAVGDVGVDADDVRQPQPGLAEDRGDVGEAELGLRAGVLRHRIVRRRCRAGPEHSTSRLPAGTSTPWL